MVSSQDFADDVIGSQNALEDARVGRMGDDPGRVLARGRLRKQAEGGCVRVEEI